MTKPYNPNDKLMHRAHQEGFRARSIYKLQELDRKFHLIKPHQTVLDLGAAPGSWLQYICTRIGPSGRALGLDLKPVEPLATNVTTTVADITDLAAVETSITKAGFDSFNLIISDLAPSTTGIPHADHVRSIELDRAALEIAQKFLRPGGSLVLKVFPGANLDSFVQELKENFTAVKLTKVQSSRDRSNEMYLVCIGKITRRS